MFYLKRILPFTLTLLAGVALGGFFNLFGSRAVEKNKFATSDAMFVRVERDGRSCSKDRSMRLREKSSPLSITYEPNTRYTKEAWAKKTTGVVRLRVTLGADGEVKEVEPLARLPHGLTEEAEKVAWRIKFNPETVGGVPVTVQRDFDYVFSLNDRMAAGL